MKTSILAILVLVMSSNTWGMPAQVILIRHGEKPATGNDLNDQGYQRAALLPKFFSSTPSVEQFGPPVAIFAMNPGASDGSNRAVETVTPLAQSLGLTLQGNYTKDDVSPLVNDIENNSSYDGHMVLICWEHKVIPLIAAAFGLQNGPTDWDGSDVFDRAWILTFDGKSVASFQDIPQHLLPGDSTQ